MASLAGAPRAAAASTAAPPRAAHLRLAPNPLKAALLTASDLPGYQSLGDPGTQWGDPAADIGACGQKPAAVGAKTPRALFMSERDMSLLFESLTATGAKAARAIVDNFVGLARRCPTFTISEDGDKMRLSLSPLTVPRLGDASAGIRFVSRMKDVPSALHGTIVVVAWRGVSLVLMQLGTTKSGQQEVATTATKAVRKLKRIG